MTNTPSATAAATGTPATVTSLATTASGISRRGLLAGAAAATAAAPVLGAGAFTPAAAAGLPLVTPVWSEKIRQSFGICVQPQMQNSTYGEIDLWTKYAADLGVPWIRGKYAASLRSSDRIIARCRALGLKWVMTLIPEDWSMSNAELRAALASIRDKASDVVIAIEGMNEPNHNRDRTPLRADWAEATVAYQKVIWDFIKSTPSLSHVKVISPSLMMQTQDTVGDFNKLRDAGVTKYVDYAGTHSYPAGLKPDSTVDTRLGIIASSWGSGLPTWVSETGYQNAMNAPLAGPRPVPTDVSATYGPRSVLEYFTRGCKSARYELLGEPGDADLNEVQAHYGLFNTPTVNPTTWTAKPEYFALQKFVTALKDTAASYTPTAVPLQVTAPSNVKWVLTAKSDGTKTLLAYLNASIWDVKHRTRIKVNPVDVVVTDRLGPRTFKVGADLVSIPVR
jgi:hypothetical protein